VAAGGGAVTAVTADQPEAGDDRRCVVAVVPSSWRARGAEAKKSRMDLLCGFMAGRRRRVDVGGGGSYWRGRAGQGGRNRAVTLRGLTSGQRADGSGTGGATLGSGSKRGIMTHRGCISPMAG
jgi:hypothetical protein